ncbi:MHYT domain-containing protein [Sphingosinicella rhizophila]|uniref:histidine kinase n=1 Tax=Sphingosinicella rhizophila TaxID=3050082 RepID=A0ABU3QBE3_9SPHN|nr:MHYT domain-containing protein [Sphingosinicella sp. GR2756]MDT9600704.1 MHYT domain-containing protein [Sphingosinicella sp. GR2756]
MTMRGTYDSALVCISILIAIVASYAALDLASRVRASDGWLRRAWLATAGIAMGGGIWAMHFVAMLAFRMPGMEVGYDFSLTFLSLAVAILVTGWGFTVMARAPGAIMPLFAAGLFMGLGIVTMHYLGMAAMRMNAVLSYDPLWLGISILIAVGAATAALWLVSRDRHHVERFGAAALMGSAVAGMHFAGMRATIFSHIPGADHMPGGAAVSQSTLAVAVSTAAFLILFLTLVAAMFDRRFAQLAEREAAALRQSEERFRSLYRATPLPLHALDRAGHIEHVSNAWLELLGYARKEVLGRPLTDFLSEPSARQMLQQDWPALLRDGSLAPRDYRMVAKAGDFLDVVSAARVEQDSTGQFLHVVGGLTDVTGRKRAEEALRQAQKLEAIGQLTGGIAHDFNNLLAVILGNLGLLRKKLLEDPKSLHLLESAIEGAQRGASLTQRLLAFARRQDLRPAAVHVPELVRGMADLLQRSLGPTIRVEMRFPLDLSAARVDAHQLEMALVNLAVNARDAMPGGGVFDISAAEQTLAQGEVEDLSAGRYVKVAIADNGTGMDEEILSRAVDPFFTTKGVGKGTGLGLSMVQGLAAQSGGRLVLRSAVGRGTTAELYLPVAERAPAPVPVIDTAKVERRAWPMRIIVVDDDPLVLANAVAMLDDLGHHVLPAAAGAEALSILKDDDGIELVITDQLMPGMTGLELHEAIRIGHPNLPVLLISGLADLDPETLNDVQLLPKPFTQDALATAIQQIASAALVPLKRRGGAV